MTLLRLETANHVVNDSVFNPTPGFTTSFNKTYFELKNAVERPRLNETNMDPEMFKVEEESKANDISYSRMITKWNFDLDTT